MSNRRSSHTAGSGIASVNAETQASPDTFFGVPDLPNANYAPLRVSPLSLGDRLTVAAGANVDAALAGGCDQVSRAGGERMDRNTDRRDEQGDRK
jgi:hypothetical protein